MPSPGRPSRKSAGRPTKPRSRPWSRRPATSTSRPTRRARPQKQAADIEGLITQKVDVILVVAFDSDAILPSIQKINDAGIKAIAYDVQFEDPNALYITFDNVGVGRLMARRC